MTLKTVTQDEAEALFNDEINALTRSASVLSYRFDAAKVLKACDPVAYRCELTLFLDARGLEIA